MSRGFVKEEDQEELPVVPPRAPLPPGVDNYVTAFGLQALMQEKEELEEEKRQLPPGNETERRHAAMFIDGKLRLLNERIASARVVDVSDRADDTIRFGATVELNNGRKIQKFQIVGVDEADIKLNKIAFTAPIVRAIIGKKEGETAPFKRGDKIQKLKILKVSYLS